MSSNPFSKTDNVLDLYCKSLFVLMLSQTSTAHSFSLTICLAHAAHSLYRAIIDSEKIPFQISSFSRLAYEMYDKISYSIDKNGQFDISFYKVSCHHVKRKSENINVC